MKDSGMPGKGLYDEAARQLRLRYLKEEKHIDFKNVSNTALPAEKVRNNIESYIGTIEVPVGIAGPLLIHGECDGELIYAPFATTEGALVASASRGAKLLTLSGGVHVRVLSQRMVRVPTFEFETMQQACDVASWLIVNTEKIKAGVKEKSRHAILTELNPCIIGKYLHIYFVYETGDASGQNMTTMCTWGLCQELIKIFSQMPGVTVKSFLLDGNLSSDKKASWQNFINGRGMRAVAECCVSNEILKQVFHISARQFIHTFGVMLGSCITTGNIGATGNAANVISAIFTATGQDIASVHEASVAQVHAEAEGDDIYLSMVMPSLTAGTVGGGTGLPGQEECLALMGCKGAGNVRRFGGILCAYALALDISTLAALSTDTFAAAHDNLGRNRPD